MKLINKTLLLLTASATILASCNKFDDLNTNPDAATKVTAPMLATKHAEQTDCMVGECFG